MHDGFSQSGVPQIGGLINLLSLQDPVDQTRVDGVGPLSLALKTLNVVKEFSEDLRKSAAVGGGWLMNVTALDGRFGCLAKNPLPAVQGCTCGIFKTLARELTDTCVKNVDLSPHLGSDERRGHLVREFFIDKHHLEVGIDQKGRWIVEGEFTSFADNLAPLPLDQDSVVLITGGACGVTAAVAKELAQSTSSRLVLVGRSPLPGAEPEETRPYRDPQSLRNHLIERANQSSENMKPAEIEAQLKRIIKDRQIRDNVAAMESAGSQVEYHALDVRDGEQFGRLIDNLYDRFGRIDGVIHGAGIVEDKWIRDKTPESFASVFSTKVDSARTLAKHLQPESLHFLFFFSSVTARFGTAGQVDYAAANEYLNKLADHLNTQWPARVVAINWGPWEGGMVTDELLRLYATRDVAVINLAAGAKACVDEIRLGKGQAAEVLIAAGERDQLKTAMNA